jgi:hypothetical protein
VPAWQEGRREAERLAAFTREVMRPAPRAPQGVRCSEPAGYARPKRRSSGERTQLVAARWNGSIVDEPDQPGRHDRGGDRAAPRRRSRDDLALGFGVPPARRRAPRLLLRPLRVRDYDRLPPLLHAPRVRGACAREGRARDPPVA